MNLRLATWALAGMLALASTSRGAGTGASPLASGSPRPSSSSQLFALVVGSNATHDSTVPALRYADDDAVQNARLLGQLGAQVVLLVTLDRDTRALYPELQATEPTRAAVLAAMIEINRRMDQARQAGKAPVLYVFYSGHGDVRNNQGEVTLIDGTLGRDEFLKLIASSHAAWNHVVIDACKSYFLVFERGPSGSRRKLRGSLVRETRMLPRNTGVFLSTSSAVDSHEWEAYQGGIFSHEMRSALRGAADANGDRIVTYDEAAAFVWTANAAILNQRLRPTSFAKPPKAAGAAGAMLADLRSPMGDRLTVGPGFSQRIYVEDDRGVRLADLHPGAGQRMELLLPEHRPMFVRHPDGGLEAEIPGGKKDVILGSLTLRSTASRARGSEHVAFSRLFEQAFDEHAVVTYRARPEIWAEETAPADPTWLRRSVGMLALVAGLAGGTLTLFSWREGDQVTADTTGLERNRTNHRIDTLNAAAIACYAIAGAAAIGYLAWTLWPRRPVEIRVQPSAASTLQLVVAW